MDADAGRRTLHYRFPPRYRVIWFALAAIVLAIVFTAPAALNSAALRIETPLIAILAIVALGQFLVVMIGGFDLSVPATMSFSSALLLKLTDGSDDKVVFAVIVVLAIAIAIGAINGLLAGPGGLNPLIVTLAMGGVVSAMALLITDAGASVLSTEVPGNLSKFATGYVGSFNNLIFVALGMAAIAAVVLNLTALGRRLKAAGSNPMAARIAGIRVARYQLACYAAAGFLYGVGGILLAAFVERPNLALGDPYLLTTFIVVALGGVTFLGGPASVSSAMGGAVFLVLLTHYLSVKGLSPGLQALIEGVVLIAAVAVVTGLSGRRGGGRLYEMLRARFADRQREAS